MEFNITWRMLAAAIIAYYGTLVFYRLFLHPLARFPGPRLAAISRWYEGYYDVVLGGKYTARIAELHKIYGRVLLTVSQAKTLTLHRSYHPDQPV